jgi:hypothetical protein
MRLSADTAPMTPRTEVHKRTLNMALLIASVWSVIALIAFSSINVRAQTQSSSTLLFTFLLFAGSCVVLVGCSAVFYEDIKRLGLSTGERRGWELAWLFLGPLALAAYWVRYVRNSRPSDEVTSPPEPPPASRRS